jgi:phosphatidylglycerol---prolipoprotein diacylglyceryl transferase
MTYIPFPDIAPEIFAIQIGDFTFALRWYALAYIVGLILGWRLVVGLMKRPALWGGTAPMAPARAEDLLTWIILGVILGGRLGFVLFYQPGFYLANPGEILKVWQGGMSFHGGFLGVVVAAWAWAARNGVRGWRWPMRWRWRRRRGCCWGASPISSTPSCGAGRRPCPGASPFPARGRTVPAWSASAPATPASLYEAVLEGLVLGAVLLWGAIGAAG